MLSNSDNNNSGLIYPASHESLSSINPLLAQLPGLVFYKNTDLVYTAASTYAARLCGFKDADQFCGHNDFELRCSAAESAPDFQREDSQVISLEKEISCLQVHQFADGNIHIFLLRKAPVRNAQGKVIGVCSIGNEVEDPSVGQAIFKLLSLGSPTYENKDFNNLNFEVNANETFNRLSDRESELIFYYMRGFSIKEIGLFMKLSPRTIESYLETIKCKFKCSTRTELLLYCMHNGFSYIVPQTLLWNCLNKSIAWIS